AWDAGCTSRPHGLLLFPPQCYTRLHHPRDCHPTPARRGNALWRCCQDPGVIMCPLSALGGRISRFPEEKKGEPMTEEGTLSIVRRGAGYQVRYASNNRRDQERLPCTCPDETHLAALLHHVGTELAVIAQVCADVRQGKMAVLLVVVSAEQRQAFFPP